MTSDPFAHGMPAGDSHTWVRAQGADCPDCECCTAALCERAKERGTSCLVSAAAYSAAVAMCPCTTRLREVRPSEDSKYCAAYGGAVGFGDTPEEARADLFAKLTPEQQANALKTVDS